MNRGSKPKKRSRIRIGLGKLYYTYKRYIDWYFGNIKYSKHISKDLLPVTAYAHKTPLLRELKSVDMWMQYNKIVNLKIAVEKLSRILLLPGETF